MFARIIDENGLFMRDDFVEELNEYTIETPCPDGFYHPKWDFETETWVEGGAAPVLTPEQQEAAYHNRVVALIREKYTENDELAILRKRLAGIDEAEFVEYNVFVEQCKKTAKGE